MTDSRDIARTVLNTLKPGVGGCVWASFVTRWGYSLVRIRCTLIHPDREMPALESDAEGLVYWPGVPLQHFPRNP
jgi:uncharacterized protein (DUF697 family)